MQKDHNAAAWLIFYIVGDFAWIALMAVKACGLAYIMGWLPLALGVVWIPAALVLVTLAAAKAMILIGRTSKRCQEWKRRRKIARTLWEAMHGLTLNSVGPIYGVQRKAGELNKDYERRILKAALAVDKVNLTAPLEAPHKPATGLKLDAIAKKQGLNRRPGESDAALQERIRTAVIEKLEKRTGHGI